MNKDGVPFGAPDFGAYGDDAWLPAFTDAIRESKKEIDDIAANTQAPDFENTIVALEYAGRRLADLEGLFFNLLEAVSSKRMQEIAEEVSPMLTELSMYILLNRPLFEKVCKVYSDRNEYGLDASQMKLLEDTYKMFARGGAALPESERAEFAGLQEELALAELRFGNNVLAATNGYCLQLTSEEDLAGLPDYVKDQMAQTAAERGVDGWAVVLQAPSYVPFMKFSGRRDLRERLYMEYNSRAFGGELDNCLEIKHIVGLRSRIASMLGYGTYADYAIEDRMAGSRRAVEDFLRGLMSATLPKAREEIAMLEEYARANGFGDEHLQPWDFSYWAERLRKEKYAFDESLLKPYFQLEKCIGAVFGLAGRLYGLSFEERKDVPVYHEDVKVYDVKDENGEHLALFYADFFPRDSKRGGAWMTEFRGQFRDRDGNDHRPFISIVTNFTKPTPSSPSLLTHNEFVTFLHEFGHSLHGMLSRGRYPSQCGTNVARDFVELPSQVMENWAYEPEYLRSFACHYQTGEPLPKEYIDRIVAAKNYLSGYYQVRQLQFGYLDMAWHSMDNIPADEGDACKWLAGFESAVLDGCRTLPAVPGTAISTSFGHIFSGGYSAGYYSYKWSELLAADAFEMFSEEGVFNTGTARKFRREILEKGSAADESVLYRNFRGHDPDPEALMRSLGLS